MPMWILQTADYDGIDKLCQPNSERDSVAINLFPVE